MNDPQPIARYLKALRSHAILLTMANEYLCDDVYLRKIGKEITENLKWLEVDIGNLKRQFPGKLPRELEPDEILDKIGKTALAMSQAARHVKNRCSSGELGRELESDIRSIAGKITLIRKQVYGRVAAYSTKDALFKIFNGLKNIMEEAGRKILFVIKVFLWLIVIAGVAFVCLYFTMEGEDGYLKEIAASEAAIRSSREQITRLSLEKSRISGEIKAFENVPLTKANKITLLDLEVEIGKINQDLDKAEAEISVQRKIVIENKNKIEKIRATPFLKRLLRQAG